MQYSFEKVKENYPKRTYRSKRSLKKMHLKEYAETIVSINLLADVFFSANENKLLDAMYEFDSNMFVCSSVNDGTNVIFYMPTADFSFEYVEKYCNDLLLVLSNIEPTFAEIESIAVQYGDAYYGEW
ncbi:virion structural protein [Pectobacterium phage vB_PcaM_CBB]|uniref:Structural protein n=1 Tax=Pectobacterium phage vB_PcaM_CBB TaxID=2772511 RepID=A0A1L2CV18_9CAUD|nr:virion structural protein [Pectobacterium phage vB_PcaM_CBB]AMM43871.1 structural protein [Pectobacterium phage vB_PcaM_CBB]